MGIQIELKDILDAIRRDTMDNAEIYKIAIDDNCIH